MRKRGGCLWLLASIVLALAAGGLAFTGMLRATAAQPVDEVVPRSNVVIVTQNVPARTRVDSSDLKIMQIPLENIPADAVRNLDDAVGMVTIDPLVAGEILLASRLADLETRAPQVAFETEPGKVIIALPAGDLMSRIKVLKPGDSIDILATYKFRKPLDLSASSSNQPGPASLATEEEPDADEAYFGQDEEIAYTFAGLQNTVISAIVMPPDAYKGNERTPDPSARPEALLLALDPQDALILKHLKDTGAVFDMALRAPEDEADFATQPVDELYLKEHYQVEVGGTQDE